eukprot:3876581-Rhodomonas_salina.2
MTLRGEINWKNPPSPPCLHAHSHAHTHANTGVQHGPTKRCHQALITLRIRVGQVWSCRAPMLSFHFPDEHPRVRVSCTLRSDTDEHGRIARCEAEAASGIAEQTAL